jgi:Cys-rich four helix bundle protein (predicted Tat secretion target)
MNRRDTLRWAGVATALLAGAGAGAHAESAVGTAVAPGAGASAADLAGTVPALQACTSAVLACIAHCQRELARGDASLGECLRTALDCDVTCNALLRAAALGSIHAPALARVSIDAMNACIAACKPHIGHHAACKACHDACVAAVTAVQPLA